MTTHIDKIILGYKLIDGIYCKKVGFGSRKGEWAYSEKDGTEWYFLIDGKPVYCPKCEYQIELCRCNKDRSNSV